VSKAPSMPMYWDAYLADTTHLTTEEHGAYLLLLAAMWRRNGSVPDNDKDNARILGLTVAKWKRTKERLSQFLIIKDGDISQGKLLEIWENTQEKITKNRENGAKGGRAVSNKNNDLAQANASNSLNPNASIPEPEPEPYKLPPIVSPAENQDAKDLWNQMAERAGLAKVQRLTETRRKALAARLKECDGLEGWKDALAKVEASPFLTGENDRNWKADFDFVVRSAKFTKIMEGSFDGKRAAIGNSIEQDILAGLGLDGGSGECADASGGDGSGRYSDQLDSGERKGICGGDGSAV